MEARMPHISKPKTGESSNGTVAFTGASVKISHADILASHGSSYDPSSATIPGMPHPDDLPPIEWPTSTQDSGSDIAATRESFNEAKSTAMKQVQHDMEQLVTSVSASSRQIGRAHTALNQQAQHHMQLSAQRTADYLEVLLQASSYAEFQSNEATMAAGKLASQLVETSEQMYKVSQIQVDIHRCHAALDELDVLMDDMERQEEMQRETALAHARVQQQQKQQHQSAAAQRQQHSEFRAQQQQQQQQQQQGGGHHHHHHADPTTSVEGGPAPSGSGAVVVPPLNLGGQGAVAPSGTTHQQHHHQQTSHDETLTTTAATAATEGREEQQQEEEEEDDPYF